jgi:hypothetical protein
VDGDDFQHRVAELATLVAEVQQRVPRDVGSALAEIVDNAAQAVPGVKYAGITVANRDEGIESMAATDPLVVTLDDVQKREGDGPCVAAAWDEDMVRIDDLTTETRWPGYCRSALTDTPVRSLVSFRVFGDHRHRAALNLFAEQPRALTTDAIELGFIFATHTAIAWGMLRRDQQFRSALASRDVIGQAKGMLMERLGINAVAAFDLLKRLSQDSNTPLHGIAERLVTTAGNGASGLNAGQVPGRPPGGRAGPARRASETDVCTPHEKAEGTVVQRLSCGAVVYRAGGGAPATINSSARS